jgi:hypothetical protein
MWNEEALAGFNAKEPRRLPASMGRKPRGCLLPASMWWEAACIAALRYNSSVLTFEIFKILGNLK